MTPARLALYVAPLALSLSASAAIDHASGTSPGLLLDGVPIPLNFDVFVTLSVTHPNAPPLTDFQGWLDASGQATAALTLAPGSVPILADTTLRSAFVLLDPLGTEVAYASNAMPLTLAAP